jgi:dTDP-4-amino-4,6-dideoxygalactose transaminase
MAAVVQAGLQVRLVDVQPDAHAEMKWSEIPTTCDAVLPCHLFGRANIIPKGISTNRFTCEDACESIYASGLGFGDAICLSFYPSHTITAGLGGMILTDDKDLYFKCWQLVNHGRQDMDDYTTCHTLKERFTFSEWGYSLKFSDLNAALGLAQHKQKDWILDKRALNAIYLNDGLKDIKELQFANTMNHTFMMFPIIIRGNERDALEKALNDENIETRRMMPITTQPIIREYFGAYNCDTNYPGAKFINEHGLYVGCHQGLGEADVEFIVQTIRKFYSVV